MVVGAVQRLNAAALPAPLCDYGQGVSTSRLLVSVYFRPSAVVCGCPLLRWCKMTSGVSLLRLPSHVWCMTCCCVAVLLSVVWDFC